MKTEAIYIQFTIAVIFITVISAAPTPPPSCPCIKPDQCAQLPNGNYQSCDTCGSYLSCANGNVFKTSCPGSLQWDNKSGRCESKSSTCPCGEEPKGHVRTHEGNDRESEEATEGNKEMMMTEVTDDAGNDNMDMMPENLTLNFHVKDEPMTLHLKRNKDINIAMPMMVGKQGRLVNWNNVVNQSMFAVYRDDDMMASFTVRPQMINDNMMRTYHGSFMMNDTQYKMEMMPAEAQRRRKRQANGGMDYMISKEDPMDSNYADALNITKLEYSNIYSDQVAPAKPSYGVETLLMVDYAIYQKWLGRSTAIDFMNQQRDALENIRFYFIHILNMIDLRYRTIKDPDFEIYVQLAGLYVATTPEDSPFTESPGVKIGPYTHAYDGLDYLENWLIEHETLLPPFDQATLYTGNILIGGFYNDGSARPISGLAGVRGICSKSRASINVDLGQYQAATTGAHEMGHSLGAQHDGLNENPCTNRDQYIMASAPGQLTDYTYKKALTFSPCSIHYFYTFLRELTLDKKNCLLNKAAHNPDEEVESRLSFLPGEWYTLDEQCRQYYGEDSFYCGGAAQEPNMCRTILCFHPCLGRCHSEVELRAFEGTACGNNKWCSNGDCIPSELAPNAPDFCIYGDYKTQFYDGRTCNDILVRDNYECYKQQFDAECCETCAKIRNDSNPGCEFGDQDPKWCSTIDARQCYDTSVQERCCQTCGKFKIDLPGCQFGDKAGWCKTDFSPSSCYSDSTCCHSCEMIKDESRPHCYYGDRADWCRHEKAKDCYRSSGTCCAHCQQYETGIESCKYGDRELYCSKADCADSGRWYSCCGTCAEEAGLVAIPTTTSTTTSTTPKTTTKKITSTTTSTAPKTTTEKITSTATSTTPKTTTEKISQTTTITTTKTTTLPQDGCIDDAPWCDSIQPHDCYVVNDTCCATCSSWYSGAPACSYGDMTSWCPDHATEEKCNDDSNFRKACCESCAQFTAADPACNREDVSWCADLDASYCYGKDVEFNCCNRCKSLQTTGNPGCEYGDHFKWCKTSPNLDCGRFGQDCCDTCKHQ